MPSAVYNNAERLLQVIKQKLWRSQMRWHFALRNKICDALIASKIKGMFKMIAKTQTRSNLFHEPIITAWQRCFKLTGIWGISIFRRALCNIFWNAIQQCINVNIFSSRNHWVSVKYWVIQTKQTLLSSCTREVWLFLFVFHLQSFLLWTFFFFFSRALRCKCSG